MARPVLGLLVVLVLLLLLALMWWGWSRRRRRQSGLPAPQPAPESLSGIRFDDELLYVATTLAGQPLERVTVQGLGFRARGRVTVADEGVVLALRGADPVLVPSHSVRGADRATWTIDRVVERDGLVLLGWSLGGTDVDTYLRADSPHDLLEALDGLGTPRKAPQ